MNKYRGKKFFENLTPFARALGAAIDANTTQAPRRKGYDVDAHAEKVEKHQAKLARRAARAKVAP